MASRRKRAPTFTLAACLSLLSGVAETGAASDARQNPGPESVADPAPEPGLRQALILVAGADDTGAESGPSLGGRGGLSWLGTTAAGTTAELGFYEHGLAGARWRFLRAGATSVRGRSWIGAGVRLGSGRAHAGSFPYLTVESRAGYAALPKSLYLDAGVEYLRIGDTRGFLVKAGGRKLLPRGVSVTMQYHFDVASTLRVRTAMARGDWDSGRFRLLGGLGVGSLLTDELAVLGEAATNGARQLEVFLGAAVPLGVDELTVVASRLDGNGLVRRSITASFRLTVAPR